MRVGLTQSVLLVLSRSHCLTLCDSKNFGLPGSSVHGIFQQECWSGLPIPSPGDLPDPGIKPASPVSPVLQVDSLPSEPLGKPIPSVKGLNRTKRRSKRELFLPDYSSCDIGFSHLRTQNISSFVGLKPGSSQTRTHTQFSWFSGF